MTWFVVNSLLIICDMKLLEEQVQHGPIQIVKNLSFGFSLSNEP